MTLDEAIKHAEEVAKKQENNAKSYPKPDRSVRGSGKKYNACLKCAEEHRQLAEWLKDYKRLLEQEPKTYVLDKIKEEIKDNTYFINETTEKEGIDFETVEKIIDKYKAESEVQDEDSD